MSETKLLDNLVVLPCRLDDIGSQRCWLGTSVMKKLNILLYDVVKIECTDSMSFVCRAWPRLDNVPGSYIQFDSTVLAAGVEQHDKIADCVNNTLSIPVNNIQRVTCSAVESVSVTVVVTDWREFMVIAKNSAELFECQIRNVLAGFVITARHAVLCYRTTLGRLYSWQRIICHSVVIKNSCNCGFITPSSKITVTEVISKERFERRSQKAIMLAGLDSEKNLLNRIVLQSRKFGLPDSLHKQVGTYGMTVLKFSILFTVRFYAGFS